MYLIFSEKKTGRIFRVFGKHAFMCYVLEEQRYICIFLCGVVGKRDILYKQTGPLHTVLPT